MLYSSVMRAKKHLGQHFLTSTKALSDMVDAGDIHADDILLEIGPGKGVLTERLIGLADKVIALEKDRELIPLLSEKFTDAITKSRLDIVEQDVLDFDPETLRVYKKPYKLIANIPYYITGAIIEKFLSTTYQPECMVLLMQREVAERIVARDGNESVLSIAVKAYGVPHIVSRVPPGAFVPAPTVESAILSIEHISRDFFIETDEQIFFAVLKAVFGGKRKQIAKTLAEYLGDRDGALSVLTSVSIDPTTRPQDMTLLAWQQLTQAITKYKTGVQ
jgi:16S rRNA (adenine1518-N6/adenine1519-N6)-dimethyltransferase